jgi:1,4-dihydroxy-2-naphthoate octaprenyltransferase
MLQRSNQYPSTNLLASLLQAASSAAAISMINNIKDILVNSPNNKRTSAINSNRANGNVYSGKNRVF